MTLSTTLSENFAGFKRLAQDNVDSTRAAVMLLVTREPGTDKGSVILTRRAKTLRRHAGQYALPGGRTEPGETPAETGLRECREEIGLNPNAHQVIGLLDDVSTSLFHSRSRQHAETADDDPRGHALSV